MTKPARWWLIPIAGWFVVGFIWGHSTEHSHTTQPRPAVVVVTLANGQTVTCVTAGQAVTCDFLGLRSDPSYRKTTP